MSGLTIGKVARETGVGIETIRFYERQGLIAEPARRPSGYRDYAPAIVERLHFILRAKDLGFSLKEIGELLSLRVDDGRTCDDVYSRVMAKRADMEQKIRHLERMKRALARMAAACKGAGPRGECPILEALKHEDEGEAGDWR
ncbi:MAG: MerR family DNA-binding protein [Candidatus Lambdaproteobacteria bacterium]|nr:MerR family DNA-binding protein [Candidatus Lambdaproteobacteria bacterium]